MSSSSCEHPETERLSAWERLCRSCGRTIGLDQATDVEALLDRLAVAEGPEAEKLADRLLEELVG